MKFIKLFFTSFLMLVCFSIQNHVFSAPDDPQDPYIENKEELDTIVSGLSQTKNPYIQKALFLKTEVDQANESDLEILWRELQSNFGDFMSDEEKEKMRNKLISKLQIDREMFIFLKKELDSKTGAERGSIPLRTSLVKLIGTEKYSGLLDDAASMLASEPGISFLEKHLNDIRPTHNKIAVLKTLLIYANLVVKDQENVGELLKNLEAERTIHLLYPANLPQSLDQKTFKALGLLLRNEDSGCSVLVPNSGFIFGGDFIDGKCKGIDCSAFLSYCTEASSRLSTMVMEYTWRELVYGPAAFSEKELSVREEFLVEWGMAQALKEYKAISPSSTGDLEEGDLVIWRWNEATPGQRSGHVVMFLGPMNESSFYGIEANRKDDKSKEGILIGKFILLREKIDTYVLRRTKE